MKQGTRRLYSTETNYLRTNVKQADTITRTPLAPVEDDSYELREHSPSNSEDGVGLLLTQAVL